MLPSPSSHRISQSSLYRIYHNSYGSVANRIQWNIFRIYKRDEESTNHQNDHSRHPFPVQQDCKTFDHPPHEDSSKLQHIVRYLYLQSPTNRSFLPELLLKEREQRTKNVHSFSKKWRQTNKIKLKVRAMQSFLQMQDGRKKNVPTNKIQFSITNYSSDKQRDPN